MVYLWTTLTNKILLAISYVVHYVRWDTAMIIFLLNNKCEANEG